MRVLMPLPHADFDPTETAVPWDVLRKAGVEVVFATEDGAPGACDPLMITGAIFGQLGAIPENVARYREMEREASFRAPMRFADVRVEELAGITIPGGHAKGMRPFLESKLLQEKVAGFFRAKRPVGAICHGGIVLARSVEPSTGHSVVHGRKMTALTKLFERSAYFATAWKLGRYYRTYPEYVQDEVIRALGNRALFQTGPMLPAYRFPFTVRDGNLVTARWPGDAQLYAESFLALLREQR